jgi:thiamine pyrophosphate-dependent acetolactate synthase large subunit-like protein
VLAAAWGRFLAEEARVPVFGLAGSGNFELLTSFVEAGGSYVPATHEASAVGMAMGWALASDQVAVASIHQGPGFTNSLTALFDAAKGRVPLVLIVPELSSSSAHQWIDQGAILESSGLPLRVVAIREASDSLRELDAALSRAMTEREVQVIMVPIDLFREPVSETRRHEAVPIRRVESDPDVRAAVSLMMNAQRPLIIVGRGAMWSAASTKIAALADRLEAPIGTTAPVHGLFSTSPWGIGIVGGLASQATMLVAQEADLVIAVGTSLDDWSTAGGRLLSSETPVISINPDSETDRKGIALQADARQALERVLEALPAVNSSGWGREAVARVLAEPAASRIPDYDAHGLDPRRLLAELNEILPAERIVCLDSGHFIALATIYLTRIARPRFLFGQDFQSVGLGLSHAIGAALAEPESLCVAIIGDGGASMSFMELCTAVERGIPVLVIVINDAAYGAEVHDFRPMGLPVGIAQFATRDWAAIARAMGADALTITEVSQLHGIRGWVENPGRPLVLDCRVDPEISAISVLSEEGKAEWSH